MREDLKVKIEITAIFVKCLCGATFNDHLKVEPRVLSKRNIGDIMPVMPQQKVPLTFNIMHGFLYNCYSRKHRIYPTLDFIFASVS